MIVENPYMDNPEAARLYFATGDSYLVYKMETLDASDEDLLHMYIVENGDKCPRCGQRMLACDDGVIHCENCGWELR